MFFGFTHCRVVCPRALQRLCVAIDALGPAAAAVTALYITVDPDRDSPDAMRRFLEPNYPHFLGLSGRPDALGAARRAFRIFARRTADSEYPDDYAVPHTAFTYLLAPDGTYAKHWPATTDAATIASELRALIDDRAIRPSPCFDQEPR